ncbi:MAG: efflux RND transporter periplasmic adaptor subunit [Vicinamibacterales bacterium]
MYIARFFPSRVDLLRTSLIAAALALPLALPLAGCSRPGTAEPPPDAAAGTAASRADVRDGTIQVTPALQQKWGITTAGPERSAVAATISLPGVLRLNERQTAQVSSLLEGQVVSLGAELGAAVRKGQVLATIHAPAFAQAKTSFLQAAARAELTAREWERARSLLRQEAIDQKEAARREGDFEQARTEAAVAESNLHSFGLDQAAVDALLRRARQPGEGVVRDELAAPYLQLTSPVAGRVIARDVIAGQHILPDRALFTVSDLSTLWAALDAREPDLPHLAAGQRVRLRTSVYAGRTWDGRILHVGDVVDERSRTVKVRVEVPNTGLLLKPNMFVQGEVAGAAGTREVLTLPADALQTINGEPVVFVRTAPDRFAVRPVEPGERAGERRVILKGLDGSERVVVAGAFTLKAELLKSSLAGE